MTRGIERNLVKKSNFLAIFYLAKLFTLIAGLGQLVGEVAQTENKI
jgi:hypothetical protein